MPADTSAQRGASRAAESCSAAPRSSTSTTASSWERGARASRCGSSSGRRTARSPTPRSPSAATPSRLRWPRSGDRSVSDAARGRSRGCSCGLSLGALAASLVHRHPEPRAGRRPPRGRDAGTRLDRLYPRYRVPIELTELDPDAAGDFDAAIVAYPHGAAAAVVARCVEAGCPGRGPLRRLPPARPRRLRATYGDHGAPELLGGRRLRAAPSSTATQVRGRRAGRQSGLLPDRGDPRARPARRGGAWSADVVISADVGRLRRGAGRRETAHFVAVDENFTPYGVEGHRHTPGDRAGAARARRDGAVTFVPHLLPLDQGAMASCFVTPDPRGDAGRAATRCTRERYADEPFVEVVDDPPGVRDVRDTNVCRSTSPSTQRRAA